METIITFKVMKTSVAWEFQFLFLEVTHVALCLGVRAGERIS